MKELQYCKCSVHAKASFGDKCLSYSVFTACLFEGAEDEGAAAVVLHVVSQVLPGNVGCAALVRTLDGKSRAVILVVLQRRERRCQNVLNDSTS